MPEVVGIADEHLAILLALTGMHVEEVRDPAAAQDILDRLLDSDAQFVIVQESFREAFSPWFNDRLLAHRGLPLVVYCPAFDKEDADVDAYLASVIRPAVGYEIRLE
ncbi:MAG TPA: hypothetical protein PLB67_11295 [Candidatus Hydrogenedentes bacterium]|jgi:vacuolar-type H+-ATPase subunit F/Vma7|nr:hypothetical protein [Candidatus Hydrogenedentota bacterium]MDY0031967.1 hypothetical protein [FCB group bacterium]NLT61548.1 hypothetical protein [Candidatus Hydrogenedentota bacterium]HNV21971.1 hypothetical protein [Candidatus Hydrogenedentota bacterium]HNZ19283.1 hypothetical protein [Candidatus Hydrogenedentota bacterium]